MKLEELLGFPLSEIIAWHNAHAGLPLLLRKRDNSMVYVGLFIGKRIRQSHAVCHLIQTRAELSMLCKEWHEYRRQRDSDAPEFVMNEAWMPK